jgi:L-lactate utilization protein LutC
MKDEDRGPLDLTLLIEGHKKEIWDYKQKESQWVHTQNQLDGHKQIVSELSEKLIKVTKASIELKKKLTEAEGETSLVKAVGINSPEMKKLQFELSRAEEINREHKKYNGDLQMSLTNSEQENIEIHADNIKLSHQIEDLLTKLKKSER